MQVGTFAIGLSTGFFILLKESAKMETVYIYGLVDPRNNQLRYIGKAKNPKQRLYYHLKEIENKVSYTHKEAWLKQLKNLSLDPILDILEKVSEYDWKEAEKWWISLVRNIGYDLTNTLDGGEGFSAGIHHIFYGKPLSEAHKKKLSDARKGPNNPMYGKIGPNKDKEFSLEHKENLRLAHLGKKQSEETKKKRSLALKGSNNHQYGKMRSDIHRQRLSQSHKGKVLSEEWRRKIRDGIRKRKQRNILSDSDMLF